MVWTISLVPLRSTRRGAPRTCCCNAMTLPAESRAQGHTGRSRYAPRSRTHRVHQARSHLQINFHPVLGRRRRGLISAAALGAACRGSSAGVSHGFLHGLQARARHAGPLNLSPEAVSTEDGTRGAGREATCSKVMGGRELRPSSIFAPIPVQLLARCCKGSTPPRQGGSDSREFSREFFFKLSEVFVEHTQSSCR